MAKSSGYSPGLSKQLIDCPFVGGMDEKFDEITLPLGKLELIENGIMPSPGAVRERTGYTALSTSLLSVGGSSGVLAGCRGLHADRDSLLQFTDRFINAYDTAQDRWIQRGRADSVVFEQKFVTKNTTKNAVDSDRATANGVTVSAFLEQTSSSPTYTLYYTLTEESSGTVIQGPLSLGVGFYPFRVVSTGTVVHVFFVDQANTDLKDKIIDCTSVSTIESSVAAAAVTVDGDCRGTNPCLDAVYSTLEGRVFIGYKTQAVTTTIKYGWVNTSGSIANTGTQTTINGAAAATESSGQGFGVAVGRAFSSAAIVQVCLFYTTQENLQDGRLVLIPFDTSGNTFSAAVQSALVDTTMTTGNRMKWVDPVFTSSTAVVAGFTEEVSATHANSLFVTATFTTGGTLVKRVKTMRHNRNVGKWMVDTTASTDNYFIVLCHESTLQSTFMLAEMFTIDTSAIPGAGIVGRWNPGSAYILNIATGFKGGQIEDMGSRRYVVNTCYARRVSTGTTAVYAESGVVATSMDFNSVESHGVVREGESSYMGGGFVHAFDGQNLVENGFMLFPEDVTAAQGTGGSLDLLKSYTYRIYFEYLNSRGERERSTTWKSLTVTLTGSNNKITLTIRSLAHTRKANVIVGVFRTEDTPNADSAFYRVTSLDPTVTGNNGFLSNSPTVDTYTFVDALSDTSLTSNELDLFSTGELDEVLPPPANIIVAGKSRLFINNAENPNRVIYSKVKNQGKPIGFNDALVFDVPEPGGKVTGLAIMNEVLVIFKERRIYRVRGDGPNNLGAGSFFEPELVASDVGCRTHRSIALTPDGLMFQSDKGIYILDQGFQLQYLGAPVEDSLGTQIVSKAVVINTAHQVRFLLPNNYCLVYDYFVKQWARFTFVQGTDCAVVDGVFYFGRSDGSVYKESGSSYSDAGANYAISIRTGWIKAHTIIGREVTGAFQRIYRILLNAQGRITSGTPGLTLRVYVNYKPTLVESFVGVGTTTDTPMDVLAHLGAYQKCKAIQIEVIGTSDQVQGPDINGVTLEFGFKKGTARLYPNTQGV